MTRRRSNLKKSKKDLSVRHPYGQNINTTNQSPMFAAPMRTFTPPVGMKVHQPKTRGASLRVLGTDYVGTLGSLQNNIQILSFREVSMNSQLFTRANQIGSIYSKYKLNKLRIHMVGNSATNIGGAVTMAGIVNDGLGGTQSITNVAGVKSLHGALTLKGWESGTYVYPVEESGLTWHTVDSDGSTDLNGSSYGQLMVYVPGTANNSDLFYDVFVEYDLEFCGEVRAGTNN